MQVFKTQTLQRLSKPRTPLTAISTAFTRRITTTSTLQKHYASLDAFLPKNLRPSQVKTTFTPADMGNHLDASSSPLVWIDCEMTGLNLQKDTIIELCCYITSPTLSLLTSEPYHTILHKPLEVMSAMDDWCTRTHGNSGLTQAVLTSTVTLEQAQRELLEFIKKHVPYPKYGLLAGNSVHADRMFLDKEFKEVVEYLHHRIVDVSSFKECVRMWCGNEAIRGVPKKKGTHRAQDDILESIEELKYYKKVFFDGK